MQKQEQKKGKGRPVGTRSYAAITKGEINNIFKDVGIIPISKRFMKSVGIDISAYPDFVEGTIVQHHDHNEAAVKEVAKPKATSKPIKSATKATPKKAAKTKSKTVNAKSVKVKKGSNEEAPIQVSLEA